MKKVLVLGATGAMGRYVVPLLAQKGYEIDAVSLDDAPEGDAPNVTRIKGNAMDYDFIEPILEKGYDGIIDFMIYPTRALVYDLRRKLDCTDHYIYLSSYRIYDNKEVPVREESPRLIDSSDNAFLRNSDDYCIIKARGENVLRAEEKKNWTIVRPSPTYSTYRYQLVTLEAPAHIARADLGKTVILPETARKVEGTLTWAWDNARFFAELLFNERAIGEAYSLTTSEHHTWEEIAEYYRDLRGMKVVWVDQDDYMKCIGVNKYCPNTTWQLIYDRLFTRIMDNSKVLAATGLKQSDMIGLYDGLKLELSKVPRDYRWDGWEAINKRMDDYLALHP